MKFFLFIFILIFFLSGCTASGLNQVKVGDKIFEVEIANTAQSRYRGLSGREKLGENQGMLFVFDDLEVRNFIMREMNFSLDMVWIKNNEVVGCSQNVQILDEEGKFIRMNSGGEINYVLEVNAGECEKNSIREGSKFEMISDK